MILLFPSYKRHILLRVSGSHLIYQCVLVDYWPEHYNGFLPSSHNKSFFFFVNTFIFMLLFLWLFSLPHTYRGWRLYYVWINMILSDVLLLRVIFILKLSDACGWGQCGKLLVTQLINNFASFCGISCFFIVFTVVYQRMLPWARKIQYTFLHISSSLSWRHL